MDNLSKLSRGIQSHLYTWREAPPRMAEDSRPTELISGNGGFNETGLEDFIKCEKFHECGVSYSVVAIVGPQSSGKSTLLNNLFHTSFREMDALSGRGRTTTGIWIAKAPNMERFTMVVDLEGTDGQERGQDDTAFEKQSALFALAVSDIVLINMWCIDIGRENAANRPLLKTIFEVMMRMFRSSRKTTLHFVIRDKTVTPFKTLETQLIWDVQKIWEIVPKTRELKDTPLGEFFNVEVTALSHYEYKKKQFDEEVGRLRNRISDSISTGGIDRVPTSGFSLHVKKLWETIKQNKDLDLPSHKKMVATVRCEEIAMQKLKLFESNKEWLAVEGAVKTGLVSGFRAKISSILNIYLSAYDSESEYFEEGVRNVKRQNLESKAFELLRPAYINTLGHLRSEALQKFETQLEQLLNKGEGFAESVRTCQQSCEVEFDRRSSDAAIKHAKWDASTVRKELLRNVKNHALQVRTDKLPQRVQQHRERLSNKVTKHLNRLFKLRDEDSTSIWASIRSFLKLECDSSASAFSSDVVDFELNQATLEQKLHDLKQHARRLVVKRFKEETENVLQLMKIRYILSLANNEDPFPKCLKLLSTMAVIRLDERDDEVLLSELLRGDEVQLPGDAPLSSCTWGKIPPEMILITPAQYKDIWVQFKQDIQTNQKQIAYVEEKEYISCSTKQFPSMSDHVKFEDEPKEAKSFPYWAKLGVWLLGAAGFASCLGSHRYELAIPLFQIVAEGGIELGQHFPEAVVQVKTAWKKGKETYRQIMKKVEAVFKRFYDFMTSIFGRKSHAKVAV